MYTRSKLFGFIVLDTSRNTVVYSQKTTKPLQVPFCFTINDGTQMIGGFLDDNYPDGNLKILQIKKQSKIIETSLGIKLGEKGVSIDHTTIQVGERVSIDILAVATTHALFILDLGKNKILTCTPVHLQPLQIRFIPQSGCERGQSLAQLALSD